MPNTYPKTFNLAEKFKGKIVDPSLMNFEDDDLYNLQELASRMSLLLLDGADTNPATQYLNRQVFNHLSNLAASFAEDVEAETQLSDQTYDLMADTAAYMIIYDRVLHGKEKALEEAINNSDAERAGFLLNECLDTVFDNPTELVTLFFSEYLSKKDGIENFVENYRRTMTKVLEAYEKDLAAREAAPEKKEEAKDAPELLEFLSKVEKKEVTVIDKDGNYLNDKDLVKERLAQEQLYFFDNAKQGPFSVRNIEGRMFKVSEKALSVEDFVKMPDVPEKPVESEFYRDAMTRLTEDDIKLGEELPIAASKPKTRMFGKNIPEGEAPQEATDAYLPDAPRPLNAGQKLWDNICKWKIFGGKGSAKGQAFRAQESLRQRAIDNYPEWRDVHNRSVRDYALATRQKEIQESEDFRTYKFHKQNLESYEYRLEKYHKNRHEIFKNNPFVSIIDAEKNGVSADNLIGCERCLKNRIDALGIKSAENSGHENLLKEYLLIKNANKKVDGGPETNLDSAQKFVKSYNNPAEKQKLLDNFAKSEEYIKGLNELFSDGTAQVEPEKAKAVQQPGLH